MGFDKGLHTSLNGKSSAESLQELYKALSF